MNLQVFGLSKSFKGKKVLDNINLSFTPGIYALLGINGAGKTTLIKCLIGVLKPDEGEVAFEGEDITKNPREYRCNIGWSSAKVNSGLSK